MSPRFTLALLGLAVALAAFIYFFARETISTRS